MQIVIDIDEEQWDWLRNGFPDEDDGEYAIKAIVNGVPLPKDHGRLIDVDDLEISTGTIDDWSERDFVYLDEIEDAPSIINADKENEK